MTRAWLLAVALALPIAARADPDNFTQVSRGAALAAVGDCTGCHTVPGGKPFAGGMMLETPFGPIATPNLTPDNETGLGRWTAGEFARAMHEGIGRDGMRLYPAFPYPFYTKVAREDVDAIYAFLRTLPPVRNPVPRDTLPFPFDIRLAMAGWNTLFFTPGYFRPDPGKSPEYNRGAYLVEGLGHCGACHTQMNWFGANRTTRTLEGGELQGWFAPNLTDDPRIGLGRWSEEEIVTYLRTGRTDRTQASGPMVEVIENSTSRMPPADLHAMAVYLKQRSATLVQPPAPVAAGAAQMQHGAAIYADNCKACHDASGAGVAQIFPRLAGSQVVQQDDPSTLMRLVLQGGRAAATDAAPTAPAMPAFAWRLSDAEVADVVTFIRNSWGNAASAVSAADAAKARP